MLSQPVTIHDVQDVESFVRAMISKTRLRITDQDERDDLVAEGMVILLDLASKYKPRMEGYDRDGSFAGYCSRFLPHKIFAAWHRMHPEHLLQSQKDEETGRVVKRYKYGEAPASWEEQLERDASLDSDTLRTPGDFARR